ncbi:MAG: hypothetical protein HYU52_13095 [Acidobacteria bacterium]|nr:hypothetical protein [Acidobacteriota bacterium]
MTLLTAALAAQLGAETRMRLRSGATAFAILAMFAVAFTYIPDPAANRVSISWERDGLLMSGLYSSAYIGWVVAMLTSMMLPFAGFYLVTGSVKRDLDRHIWPIVASTPAPRAAYLAGKLLASFAYLLLLGGVTLIPATLLFFRYGHGPFEPLEIVTPWLLLVPPALLFTAAMALLFDVTPGLRGRGGFVLWFFAWTVLFFLIPGQLSGVLDRDRVQLDTPAFDPAGIIFVEKSVQEAIGTRPQSLNLGVGIISRPLHRVEFPGTPVTAQVVLTRAAQCGWSVVVLGLATIMFPLGAASSARAPRAKRTSASPKGEAAVETGTAATAFKLVSHPMRPSFVSSVIADTILTWKAASWLKWPTVVAALLAGLLPAGPARGAFAVTLLLVAIMISETAAREPIAGTSPLVFAQPGTPRSIVAWKCASVGLFVTMVFLPSIARTAVMNPERLVSLLFGLAFVVAASVSLGLLTKGGRFFSALFTAAWYTAVQGALDFTGMFAVVPGAATAAAFAAAALLTLAAAWLMEQRTARVGSA